MLPDISEFSYGYALTSELIHSYHFPLADAPHFPTQKSEGKKGGYDVALPRRGVPLLLQFKRSDCMVRNTAAHAHQLGVPHFRFHLRPRRHSDQHALLLGEENTGAEVYYAAPRFHRMDELNDAYLAKEVAERSTFIKPSDVGALPDDKDHFVAVSNDNKQWFFCSSESRRIPATGVDKVLRAILPQAARERGREINNSFFLDFGDQIVERFVSSEPAFRERERSRANEVRRQRQPAQFAREVAQMLLGCELLLVLAEDEVIS